MRRLVAAWVLLSGCGLGAPSSEDACAGIRPGALVITEYLNDPVGTDTGAEYFEVFNASGSALDWKGLTLRVSRSDGSQEKRYRVPETLLVEPDGMRVFGDVRGDVLPETVDVSYRDALGALPNASGRLALLCADTVVDEISLEAPARAGEARNLDGSQPPDAARNELVSAWCDASPSPGAPNASCGSSMQCIDSTTRAARPVRRPRPGEISLSEFLADPTLVADSEGEWMELQSRTDAPVDVNGLMLDVGKGSIVLRAETCLTLGPMGFATLARNVDPALNGGVRSAWGPFGFSLPNAGAAMVLRDAEVVLDSVPAMSARAGMVWQRSGEAWCAGQGTPGASNVTCAEGAANVDGSRCRDPRTGALREPVTPRRGDVVLTEFMADPAAVSDDAGEWVELFVTRTVDLQGVSFNGEDAWTSPECLMVEAGSHVVLARNLDPAANGGISAGVARFGGSLANSGVRSIRLTQGEAVLDEVAYEGSRPGIAMQLDPLYRGTEHNDDRLRFCESLASYGAGDRGTPGKPNASCAR